VREWLRKERTLDRIAPFAAVLFGLLVGVILILFTKNNPVEGFKYLIQGGIKGVEVGNFKRVGNVLLLTTPLMLSGLAVAFAFRTGVFNIGVSGQMMVGGLFAVYIGSQFEMPRIIHVPLVMIVGMIAGALWALIPALLKAKYKVNEVVTTIMMNYVALELVKYFVKSFMPGHFETESARILSTSTLRASWMYEMFDKSNVNIGLFVAVIMGVIFSFILNRTTFGYELKAVGFNKEASKYAGIKVDQRILHAMMISGAIAGIAGVVYYLGNTDHIKIGQIPSFGFDGIAVALLGLNSAIGIFFASLLFGFLKTGGGFMNAMIDIPNEIVDIMIAVIIYFSATSLLFKNFIKKMATQKKAPAKNKGGAK
jgi:simple sugar transport system permease protein